MLASAYNIIWFLLSTSATYSVALGIGANADSTAAVTGIFTTTSSGSQEDELILNVTSTISSSGGRGGHDDSGVNMTATPPTNSRDSDVKEFGLNITTTPSTDRRDGDWDDFGLNVTATPESAARDGHWYEFVLNVTATPSTVSRDDHEGERSHYVTATPASDVRDGDEQSHNVTATSASDVRGGHWDERSLNVNVTAAPAIGISQNISYREGSGDEALPVAGRSGQHTGIAHGGPYDRCTAKGEGIDYPCHAGYKCRMERGRVVCSRDCRERSCNEHGTCVEDQSGYRCVCHPGFEGYDCETFIAIQPVPPIDSTLGGACSPDPCKGDCTCRESCKHEGGYFCSSRGGYVGKDCTIPIPKVSCGQNRISIDIPGALYEEFDNGMGNSYLYASPNYQRVATDEKCEAFEVDGNYRFTIDLPFTSCGTLTEKSGAYAVVRNRLFVDRRADLFSMAVPVVDFECQYEKQYQLITSLKTVINQPASMSAFNELQPMIELCKVSSCPAACPANLKVDHGAVYTVGEMIHVTVTTHPTIPMNDFLGYVTSVYRMALSCSREPPVGTELHLIDGGCDAETGFHVTTKAGRVACVGLQTPRGMNCEAVYIHMHLVLCKPNELLGCSNGEATCPVPPPARRTRRSISALRDGVTTTLGPLFFIEGRDGEETTELYPGAALAGRSLVFKNGKLEDFDASVNTDNEDKHEEVVAEKELAAVGQSLVLAVVVPGAVLTLLVLLSLFAWYSMSAAGLRSTLTSGKDGLLLIKQAV